MPPRRSWRGSARSRTSTSTCARPGFPLRRTSGWGTLGLFTTGHFDRRKADVVVIKRVIVATVLVALAGSVALAQSTDPQVGTWKLNAEKSKGTMFKGGT